MRTGDFSATGTQLYDPATGSANGTGPHAVCEQPHTCEPDRSGGRLHDRPHPDPNQSVFPNNYLTTATYSLTRDNFDFKVNYVPTDKMQFGGAIFSPTDIFDPPSLGAAGGDATNGGQPGHATGLVQSAGIAGSYTVTPHVLIDGVVGYTRLRLGCSEHRHRQELRPRRSAHSGHERLPIPAGGYPRLPFSTFSNLGNPNVSNPFLFRDPQYVQNVSWIRGSHSLRFGFEYSKYNINHFQPQASNGPRGGLISAAALLP